MVRLRWLAIAACVVLLSACGLFSDPEAELARATQAYANHDYRGARIRLEALKEVLAKRGDYHHLFGLVHLETGNPKAALREFEIARELGFSNRESDAKRAEALLAVGEPAKVIEELPETGALQQAGKGELLLLRARAYRRLEKWELARETYQAALTIDRTAVPAQIGLGQLALAQGDLAEANTHLEAAIRLGADGPDVLLLEGDLAFSERRFEFARAAYSNVLAKDGDSFSAASGLVRTLIAMGEAEQAKREAERLSKIHPNSPLFLYFKALFAHLDGDVEKSLRFGTQLYELQPGFVPNLTLLGSSYLAKGQTSLGRQYLEQAYRLAPGSGQVRLQLARTVDDYREIIRLLEPLPPGYGTDFVRERLLASAYLKEGREDAVDELAEWLSGRQTQRDLALQVATGLWLQLGRVEEAKAIVAPLLRDDPERFWARWAMARIASAEGNAARAQHLLSSLLEQQPENPRLLMDMAGVELARGDEASAIRILEQVRSLDQNSIAPRVQLVKIRLRRDEQEAVDRLMGELQSFVPQSRSAAAVLAEVALSRGEEEKAQSTIEKALEAYPNDGRLRYLLGRALLAQGKLEDAIAAWEQGLFQLPRHLPTVASLVSAYGQQNRWSKAERLVRSQLAVASETAELLTLLGDALTGKGEPAAAFAAYGDAYRKAPSGSLALKRFRASRAAGNEDASDLLEQHLKAHPRDDAVRLFLAQIYQQEGNLGRSADLYEEVVNANPENAVALNNLAWIYHRTGKPNARVPAQRAFHLAPQTPEIAHTYGTVLLSEADPREALTILRKAWEAHPGNLELGFHASRAYVASGQVEKAKALLAEILGGPTTFPSREEAETLLAKL